MAISILQVAQGNTVYPEIPLTITFPAVITSGSKIAVVVFGNSTGGPFNTSVLDTEVTAPTVTDALNTGVAATDTFTEIDHIDNLYQEIGSVLSSPPLVSPDLSAYFLSGYTYYCASLTANVQSVVITDAAFYAATALPRAAHDGGFAAIALEIAGANASPLDQHSTVTGDTATLGVSLITPGANSALTIEAGMLMDSSSLVPGTKPTGSTVLYTFSDRFPAGSSFWTVQVTLQAASETATSGFANPIYYTGGVLAFSLKT